MGALGGLYGPTPRGTMVIWLGAGPSRLSLWLPSSLPTTGARRLAQCDATGCVRRGRALPAGVIVAVLLMTRAWSWGRGNSPAAWRAITVATPRRVWLMACGAHGKDRPTLRGRL